MLTSDNFCGIRLAARRGVANAETRVRFPHTAPEIREHNREITQPPIRRPSQEGHKDCGRSHNCGEDQAPSRHLGGYFPS